MKLHWLSFEGLAKMMLNIEQVQNLLSYQTKQNVGGVCFVFCCWFFFFFGGGGGLHSSPFLTENWLFHLCLETVLTFISMNQRKLQILSCKVLISQRWYSAWTCICLLSRSHTNWTGRDKNLPKKYTWNFFFWHLCDLEAKVVKPGMNS